MINKRGNLPVVVLVVLTLVLSIWTLFVFTTNANKFDTFLKGVGYSEEVYVKENIAKYQIYIVGKDLLNNSSLTKENFKAEFLKFKFEEDYLIELSKFISQDKFKVTNNEFELIDPENIYSINDTEKEMNITYYTKLKVDLK